MPTLRVVLKEQKTSMSGTEHVTKDYPNAQGDINHTSKILRIFDNSQNTIAEFQAESYLYS